MSAISKINEKYKKKFYEKELVKIIFLLDELKKDKYIKCALDYAESFS